MKIVLFSRFPSDINSPRGGVETATIGLVKGLQSIGAGEIHVITLEKNRKEKIIINIDGVTIHRLPGTRWPMILDIFFGPGRRMIDRYISELNPDIIHYQETYGLGAPNIGIPTVFTLHGFDSLNLPTEKSRLWRVRAWLWKKAEAIGLKRLQHIISITPYVRNKIEALTEATIYDIDNAISEKYFNIERNEMPGRVFFAGWLNQRKNALGLIRAVGKVVASGEDVTLHVAGEASDSEYSNLIDTIITELNLTDYVTILGRINQNEVVQELSMASIFILPSYQENAPMIIAESMATGIPVISSNVCGMPYMIEDGVTGFLVAPDDIDLISKKIIRLCKDSALRMKISEAGRKVARKRFHPVSVARKTLDVYHQIQITP